MTTIVDIQALWVHEAGNPVECRALPLVSLTRKASKAAEYRTYASHRVRRISSGDDSVTYSVILHDPSAGDREWLAAHRDATLIVRDPEGTRLTGSFLDLEEPFAPVIPGRPRNGDRNVTLEFTAETYDESV